MILTVELNKIGIKRWESFGMLGVGFVGLGMSSITHRRDELLNHRQL